MKIYLMCEYEWKLFDGEISDELAKRNITIGEGSQIGSWSQIGERSKIGPSQIGSWSQIGEGSEIGLTDKIDYIVMGPFGSRKAMLTGYVHKKELWIGTGCFCGSAVDFLKKVKETHDKNNHAKDYIEAVEYIKKRVGL